MKQKQVVPPTVITAGSTYLDIDAYACMVAMAELLNLRGDRAIAYSTAPCNYSVCAFLSEGGQVARVLPEGVSAESARYIIVDVSDPEFLHDSVPLDRVVEIYDHHVGFEAHWASRIGQGAHIEFIGAAATLVWREWQASGLQDKMSPATARLLIAAILDNTLNLTSSNTTREDVEAFEALCKIGSVNDTWRAVYFSEVQAQVEADLKNALFHDVKCVRDNPVLPDRVAQLCVWDAERVFARLGEIREWFEEVPGSWMINLIDLKNRCSYFVCDDLDRQTRIAQIFDVRFESGVARSDQPYLRKQIIKTVLDFTPRAKTV